MALLVVARSRSFTLVAQVRILVGLPVEASPYRMIMAMAMRAGQVAKDAALQLSKDEPGMKCTTFKSACHLTVRASKTYKFTIIGTVPYVARTVKRTSRVRFNHHGINIPIIKQAQKRSIAIPSSRDLALAARWKMPVQAEKVIGRTARAGKSWPATTPCGTQRANARNHPRIVMRRKVRSVVVR